MIALVILGMGGVVSCQANSRTENPPTPIPATDIPTVNVSPTPALGIGSKITSNKDGMTLLYVPAGFFTMGSDDSVFADEKPVHKVILDDFWIDQTEVTNKMYSLCVKAGNCKEPIAKISETHSSYYGNSEFDNYPVIFVDWIMAKTYCEWADRHLLTEAEWEKAARGDDGRTYPWGNNAPNNSLLNQNGVVGDTTSVGKYPSGTSPYGALDMSGNVSEWVADWYGENYYVNSPSSNPLGPDSGKDRVLRGSSWIYPRSGNVLPDFYYSSAYRNKDTPSDYFSDIGFRCAVSP